MLLLIELLTQIANWLCQIYLGGGHVSIIRGDSGINLIEALILYSMLLRREYSDS